MRDSRLKKIYAGNPSPKLVNNLIVELKNTTMVKMTNEGDESPFDRYFIALNKDEICDVMDAMSSIKSHRRWRFVKAFKNEKEKYVFENVEPFPSTFEINRRKDKYDKIYKSFDHIWSALDSNPSLMTRITGKGIQGAEIPQWMKRDLMTVIQANRSDIELEPGAELAPITNQDIERLTFQMIVTDNPRFDFDQADFRVRIPGLDSLSFTYARRNKELLENNDSNSMIYNIHDGENKTVDYKKYTNLFKRECRLNVHRNSVIDIVLSLQKQTECSFFCDQKNEFVDRRDIYIPDTTLGVILNKLTYLFPGTGWELRKSGVILIRSPRNPLSKERTPRI